LTTDARYDCVKKAEKFLDNSNLSDKKAKSVYENVGKIKRKVTDCTKMYGTKNQNRVSKNKNRRTEIRNNTNK
jgi:flagellar motor protein MotB